MTMVTDAGDFGKTRAYVDGERAQGGHAPVRWCVVSKSQLNRLSVQIHNKSSSGSIDGFIMVHAIRRHRATTLMKEMDELKGYFNTALDVTQRVLPQPYIIRAAVDHQ
jgi:hypothetical protein